MVLPSDCHLALREWLESRRVPADEWGGTLVIQDLDGLLRLSGARDRLTAGERQLLEDARAYGRARGPGPLSASEFEEELSERVHAVLQRVCDALEVAGISARPGLGLGITFGNEIFAAVVYVRDTTRLYELMRATTCDAELNRVTALKIAN